MNLEPTAVLRCFIRQDDRDFPPKVIVPSPKPRCPPHAGVSFSAGSHLLSLPPHAFHETIRRSRWLGFVERPLVERGEASAARSAGSGAIASGELRRARPHRVAAACPLGAGPCRPRRRPIRRLAIGGHRRCWVPARPSCPSAPAATRDRATGGSGRCRPECRESW